MKTNLTEIQDALLAIGQSDERPGHPHYLSKSSVAEIARECIPLINEAIVNPAWPDLLTEALDALEAIGAADEMPGHVHYLSKARMAEVAREVLRKSGRLA